MATSTIKKSNALTPADVVNNLTSGGTTVPLSAEMGKELNIKITQKVKVVSASCSIPAGGTSHAVDITLPNVEADTNYYAAVIGRGGNQSYVPVFSVSAIYTDRVSVLVYNCGNSGSAANRDVYVVIMRNG